MFAWVYVCQFQRMHAFHPHADIIDFDHLRTFCIKNKKQKISRAANDAANTSTLKIKSHNVNTLCLS